MIIVRVLRAEIIEKIELANSAVLKNRRIIFRALPEDFSFGSVQLAKASSVSTEFVPQLCRYLTRIMSVSSVGNWSIIFCHFIKTPTCS